MSELIQYTGNCHCGAVKFTVGLPKLESTTLCECSICSKKGIMWNFPGPGQLKFVRGEEKLKTYEFGAKYLMHKFCPTCGVQVIGQFKNKPAEEAYAINTRCLMDIDPWSLKTTKFDGASITPRYEPPPFTEPEPDFDGEGLKLYTGSCHCGKVRIALKSKPLPECEVKEDNCSICIRHAATYVYPRIAQVAIHGEENTTSYTFARKFLKPHFCSTCGVLTHYRILGPPKEVQDGWTPEIRARNARNFDMLPVNLRVLDGVEWAALEVKRDEEEINMPPLYKVD